MAWRWRAILATVLLAAVASGRSQAMPEGARAVREIRDPCLGKRWELSADARQAGGPGRLVLRGTGGSETDGPGSGAGARRPVVIRAGDALVVEERSAVVQGRLAAVALESASAGQTLRVRLIIGGKVLQATATGPHRATLSPKGAR